MEKHNNPENTLYNLYAEPADSLYEEMCKIEGEFGDVINLKFGSGLSDEDIACVLAKPLEEVEKIFDKAVGFLSCHRDIRALDFRGKQDLLRELERAYREGSLREENPAALDVEAFVQVMRNRINETSTDYESEPRPSNPDRSYPKPLLARHVESPSVKGFTTSATVTSLGYVTLGGWPSKSYRRGLYDTSGEPKGGVYSLMDGLSAAMCPKNTLFLAAAEMKKDVPITIPSAPFEYLVFVHIYGEFRVSVKIDRSSYVNLGATVGNSMTEYFFLTGTESHITPACEIESIDSKPALGLIVGYNRNGAPFKICSNGFVEFLPWEGEFDANSYLTRVRDEMGSDNIISFQESFPTGPIGLKEYVDNNRREIDPLNHAVHHYNEIVNHNIDYTNVPPWQQTGRTPQIQIIRLAGRSLAEAGKLKTDKHQAVEVFVAKHGKTKCFAIDSEGQGGDWQKTALGDYEENRRNEFEVNANGEIPQIGVLSSQKRHIACGIGTDSYALHMTFAIEHQKDRSVSGTDARSIQKQA